MPLISSISGVRGTIPDSLTPDAVKRYTDAFSQLIGGGSIVVGRDGRPSGREISAWVCETLSEHGHNVAEIGIVPTPTVQMEIERLGAAGGIAITASHNPEQWNGLKFLAGSGMFLNPDENKRLNELAEKIGNGNAAPNSRTAGTITHSTDAVAQHIKNILAIPFLDKSAIRNRRFRIVADAVNAAGSVAVPMLLEQLGCEVIPLACDGSGIFPHTPEPLAQNLSDLCSAVRLHNADLGIAVDPDADRLVLITEKGEPFGEEYTIVQCVKIVLAKISAQTSANKVVINLSTTRAVEDVASQYGAETIRTPVGEINVALKMKQVGAVIGGEGSGGVILSNIHYGRDSLVGCALTLQHLADFNGTASALRATLPDYSMVKRKITLQSIQQAALLLGRVAQRYSHLPQRTDDGVRADFPNGDWVHVRSSNTEPIIRFIAESKTHDGAVRLADELEETLAGGMVH